MIRQVLKTAIRHEWLAHLPDLSPPYKTSEKVVHRPWFSPDEYQQLYTATREHVRNSQPHYKWNAEQLHDYVLFLARSRSAYNSLSCSLQRFSPALSMEALYQPRKEGLVA
jgi:hypothetical protein